MRLIDADAMEKRRIDYIVDGYAESVNDMTEWGMALIEAPTIGGWIPCSERLPDDMTYVLTTIHIPGREPVVRSGFYENGLFHNDNGDVWKATDIEVVAWQPLPEPYKEDD